MSKVLLLRALVEQRLTAAAEEIFGLFERTIAEYEEELCRSKEENERQQKLLDAVFKPQLRLHRSGVQQQSERTEVSTEQQEMSTNIDSAEPRCIKEEQEESWTSQGREQLERLDESDIIKFTFFPVKSEGEEDEDADEDKEQAQYSHHQRRTERTKTGIDGEDCGGPEPAKNSDSERLLQPETDNGDGVWKETSEVQSGSKTSEVSVRYIRYDTEKMPFGCLEGGQIFDTNSDLMTPKTTDAGEKPFSCSVCNKSFNESAYLKNHVRTHTGEKPFSCSVCSKRFNQKANLYTHMKTHTGEKPFSCSFCSKTFSCKAHLDSHLRSHTGEKPFNCTLCSKTYSRKSHLEYHLRSHMGEKPFSCPLCSKQFSQKCSLDYHLKIHTGEKPFSCSICGKQFIQKVHMKQHMTSHTGEKPFSCSICGKTFTQKVHMTQHMTSHTREKQHSCSVCDKSFTRRSGLKNHRCIAQLSPHSHLEESKHRVPLTNTSTDHVTTDAAGKDSDGHEPGATSSPDSPETDVMIIA